MRRSKPWMESEEMIEGIKTIEDLELDALLERNKAAETGLRAASDIREGDFLYRDGSLVYPIPPGWKLERINMEKRVIVHMTSEQFWQLIEMKLALPDGVHFVGTHHGPATHPPTSQVILGGPGLPDWCPVAHGAQIRFAEFREENHRLVLIDPTRG